MDFKTLYNFMLKLTSAFENSKCRKDFACGLESAFSKILSVEKIKIYILDEFSFILKDFEKPWENLSEDESMQIQKVLNSFVGSKESARLSDNIIYMPILEETKILGALKIIPDGSIDSQNDFFQIAPLVQKQISYAILNFKSREKMQLNTKFYQTIRNIAKIIETQYELSYILPVLGEMIDGFIHEHLIYIFIKNKNKKDFKLVWPANIKDVKIYGYLEQLTSKSGIILEREGKVGIFPLLNEQKLLGAIVACNPFDKLNENEINYLDEISKQASITIERASEYMKILKDATLDALTGLNNRHQFALRLREETASAKRQNKPLCCIMTDIDFFKKVNDTYGHAVGDCVLKNVARTIKKELRENDIPSRYGGEEFAILLPYTTLEEASLVAQRLRAAIEKKKINIEEYNIDGVKQLSVTISVGVSIYDKSMKEPDMLYQNADKALYEAKEGGRNRVVVYKP